jgi:sulfur carrier protein ThiS
MIVRLKLLGDARRHAHGGGGSTTRDLPAGARVADLIGAIGIPADEELIVGINGRLGSPESALADGDEVMLVTPMAGGANRWQV